MKNKSEIYRKILARVSPNEEFKEAIQIAKAILKSEFDKAFLGQDSYYGLKYIGSSVTGNSLIWKKDIDGIVILNPFSRQIFREGVNSVSCLENKLFKEKSNLINDKVDARFREFEVNIGCIDKRYKPEENLGADISMHPDFIRQKLGSAQNEEVLLTKMFFKNAGIPGGKVGGFAIEQLIIYFDNFDNFVTALKEGHKIYIDFSGKYSGQIASMVVSYPYCGLDNLAKITETELKSLRDYARIISESPEVFLIDSLRTANHLMCKK